MMLPDDFIFPADQERCHRGRDQGSGCGSGILVVDDDPDLVKGLTRILKVRGFEVFQAVGGCQAVEMAKVHRPKAILTDIMMPDLNGIQASRQIKEACPGVIVMFMTGYADIERQALAEGAAAVFRKPLDYAKLFETLDGLGLGSPERK